MILPATEANIHLAAEAIRSGRLVGMPTETVYGVAADALNPEAVRATFAAKRRPAENPLIVHVASLEAAGTVALVSHMARALAERFWPGPLTLVLPKRPSVPDVTTGGLATVAVRVPAHPVARALISAAGTPLSAPSANLFMGLSPTRATDIDPALASALAFILDGGPCAVGLESTVLDLSEGEPRLLRPGVICADDLFAALGIPVLTGAGPERRSPGLYPRHYAPRAPVILVARLAPTQPGITLSPPLAPDACAGGGGGAGGGGQIELPNNPAAYAAGLYAALHDLDRQSPPAIYIESPPETPAWSAVWDRLRRAATPQ